MSRRAKLMEGRSPLKAAKRYKMRLHRKSTSKERRKN
jgi:hypothetical protein